MSNQPFARLFSRWVNRIRPQRRRTATYAITARPQLEGFEDRITPTTLSAPSVVNQRSLVGGGAAPSNSAGAALDPTNPNRLAFATTSFNPLSGQTSVVAQVSLDGGYSYRTFFANDGLMLTNPNTRQQYTDSSNPVVAWGRNGTVAVAMMQHNADKSAGVIVAYSFDADANFGMLNFDANLNPVPALLTNPRPVIYQWSGLDQAYNLAIGVDTNIASSTDPDTGTVNADPMAGAAKETFYVAWNTNATKRAQPAGTWNPNVILYASSSDRGRHYSSPMHVMDGGYLPNAATADFGADSALNATSPQIAFSADGALTFLWNNINTRALNVDTSRPDGGVAATPAVATRTFWSNEANVNKGTTKAITDATVPASGPHIAATTILTFTVDAALIAGFGTITDVDVGLSMYHNNDLKQIGITLVSPAGTQIPLVRPGTLPDGSANSQVNFFAPGFNQGGTFAGDVGKAGDGTQSGDLVFDDQGPRVINDTANKSPYIGHFQPEGLSLAVLNGLAAAATTGTWKLQIVDNRGEAPNPVDQQVENAWIKITSRQSNNFVGTAGGKTPPLENQILTATPMLGGKDNTATWLTPSSSPRFKAALPVAEVLGLPANAVLAYDNAQYLDLQTDPTKANFNTVNFRNRLYVAYTAPVDTNNDNFYDDTDIYVVTSDNYGKNFSGPVRVNDDSAGDFRTSGVRPQFSPSIAVDSVTGAVVVMWYDTRDDASATRSAAYIATSMDGGATWSQQHAGDTGSYLNTPKGAADAIDLSFVSHDPIPDNLSNSGQAAGLGRRQALAAYNGKVFPFYTGNANGGGNSIRTATVRIQAGPSILASDTGLVDNAVTLPKVTRFVGVVPITATVTIGGTGLSTYNNTFAADGSRRLDGFVVKFDRPIDPTTFDASDIRVEYRAANALLTDPPTVVANLAPVPLTFTADVATNQARFNDLINTQFFVRFTTPQTGIGTYSYSVGPYVRDKSVRTPGAGPGIHPTTKATVTLDEPSVAAYRGSFATTVNQVIPDNPNSNVYGAVDAKGADIFTANPNSLTSSVTLPGLLNGQVVGTVLVDLNIDHPRPAELNITLTAPDGTVVTLQNLLQPVAGSIWNSTLLNIFVPLNNPDDGNLTRLGDNFTATRFQDDTDVSIVNAAAPYTGTFRPQVALNNLIGRGAGGKWTLTVTDVLGNLVGPLTGNTYGGNAGKLLNWNLTVLPGRVSTGASPSRGNWMDQNANGRFTETAVQYPNSADALAVPTPATGKLFTLPYAPAASALVLPGPHVRIDTATEDNVSVAGQAASLDNMVLNAGATSIDVTFTHKMDPTTFTADDVIGLTTPTGVIVPGGAGSGFTVALSPKDLGASKTFRVTFPNQVVQSGQYSLLLGSDITASSGTSAGYKVDANRNAGVDKLRGGNATTEPVATQTYASTAPAVAVPFGPVNPVSGAGTSATVAMTIDVPDDFTIQQDPAHPIQVKLNIIYPNTPDLRADLVAPDGTRIRLFTSVGTVSQANFINVLLDDSAKQPIQQFGPLPPGQVDRLPFTPQRPLSVLHGKNAKGTWRLEVSNAGKQSGSISNFSLFLPKAALTGGTGEDLEDRTTVNFRVFQQDPTNDLTRQIWTPVGPTSTNNGDNVGRATALAVDSADPSGNTVYVGGASGGVWKTTNFLTYDANGPTWIPLTDFGPTYAMNIGSIALIPIKDAAGNPDPSKTIVFALTGEGQNRNTQSVTDVLNQQTPSPGVGVLRSLDAGKTWAVLDSTTNAFGTAILPINSFARDHVFLNTSGYEILVDPTPTQTPNPDGSDNYIVYMANGPSTAGGAAVNTGVWRSNDTGRTWSLIRAGIADDIALSLGSKGSNGNVETLYAGFRSEGVYITTQATSAGSMKLLPGGDGNRLIRDVTVASTLPAGAIVNVAAPSGSPNGDSGRLVLATPAYSTDPLKNIAYAGWLYVLKVSPDGTLDGLFSTKDFGLNWTEVHTPVQTAFPGDPRKGTSVGINDDRLEDADIFATHRKLALEPVNGTGQGGTDAAITLDPNDPNIIFIAGLGSSNGAPLSTSGSLRIDTSLVHDVHSFINYDNQGFKGGVSSAAPGGIVTKNGVFGSVIRGDGTGTYGTDFVNLQRDPDNPFITASTIQVIGDPLTGSPVQSFTNDGFNALYKPYTDILATAQGGANDVTRIVPVYDQATGLTRYIYTTDHGVFSGVDDGSGNIITAVGLNPLPTNSRNGNLQIGQFYQGAVQPSQLAADVAGAMFYATSAGNGFPVSAANVFQTGNTAWRNPIGDGTYVFDPTGTQVAVDQGGSGTAYEYRLPLAGGPSSPSLLPSDFVRVFQPGTDHGGQGVSRTNGLVTGTDDPGKNTGQWGALDATIGFFAVNPIDPNGMVIASNNGNVYRSTNQGRNWAPVNSTALTGDKSGSRALAYGAERTDAGNKGLLNNFIWEGTNAGEVFVTLTGGGFAPDSWIDLGNVDGTPIQAIRANPRPNSSDAIIMTQKSIFYVDLDFNSKQLVAVADITGNLFNITRTEFGVATNARPTLKELLAVAVDWRYREALLDPNDPTSPLLPVIYAGGDGGVFRTVDAGQNWTYFPDVATDGAPVEGGYLPNARITDLDLAYGNIDPKTGMPIKDVATGQTLATGSLNILVATTWGRGSWAIRLSNDLPADQKVSGPAVERLANRTSPVTGPTTSLDVFFNVPVDNATFSAADVKLFDTTGAPVPVTSVVPYNPNPSNPDPRTGFTITFPTQAVTGYYKLQIGAVVSDFAGNLMNQDGDATNGEPVEDVFNRQVYLNGFDKSLVITKFIPTTITAGVPAQFIVQATDAAGNILTGNNDTFTISITDPQGSVPTTFVFTNGVATVPLLLKTAGTTQVTVTDLTAGYNPGKAFVNVIAAQAASFIVTDYPTPVVAGTTNPFTVTAKDAFNNLADSYGGTILFTSSDPQAGLPATGKLTAGVGTFTASLKTVGTHSLTATDNTTPTVTGTQFGIQVTPAAAASLVILNLTNPVTAGDPAGFTVQAKDLYGNVDTNYAGTVNFASNTDLQATVPGSAGLVSGSGAFAVTFRTAGTQSIAVVDAGNAGLNATASTLVRAAAASKYVITGLPAQTTAGLTNSFTVTAKDPFGNVADTYPGKVKFTSDDPQAGLPATLPLTKGVGVFSATLKTAGTKTITATDTADVSVTGSASTVVLPSAPAQLIISPIPSPVVAGTSVGFTVSVVDTYGNPSSNFTDTVSFTSSDAQATLPVSYTFVPADNGTHAFTVTFRSAGGRNVTANAAGPGVNPGSAATNVVPAAASKFIVSGLPSKVTAGVSAPFNVTAQDAFGNQATNYFGTVGFTSTDAKALLPAGAGLTAGGGNFAVTFKTAGPQSITATDAANSTVVGVAGTTVSAAATAGLFITGLPANTVAGTPATFTVSAKDAFGNASTGFQGTVFLNDTDPNATIPSTYTFLPADNGAHTFTVTHTTAGPQTVTVGPIAGSLAQGTASTLVAPAAATKFVITGVPDPFPNNTPVVITVTAQDKYGNTATGFTGAATFSSTDAAGTLPGTYTFTAADKGVHDFTVTLKTGGAYTLTVTAGSVSGSVSGTTAAPPVPPPPANTPPVANPDSATVTTGKSVAVAVLANDTDANGDTLTVTSATTPAHGSAVVNSSGTITYTPASGFTGTDAFAYTISDGKGGTAVGAVSVTVTAVVPPPPPPKGTQILVGYKEFAAGADAGGAPLASLYNPDGSLRYTLQVFPTGFTGGVRAAAADFTGDGVADLIVGTGPGVSTQVRVIDGVTKAEILNFAPFEPGFVGGVYVAAGDVNGDGIPELIVTPDEGGGPRVRVFDGKDLFRTVIDFFGIDDPDFRGGARAAVGDVNGDGFGDLIVAAGFGGGPRVAGFSGATLESGKPARVFADFFAFEQTLRNGVFIAAGDINGDGFAEVIAGGGPGGGPRVTAFSGQSLLSDQYAPLANFFGGDSNNRGGVRITVKNLDNDTKADLVVGSGAGAGTQLTGYFGKNVPVAGTPPIAFDFAAFDTFKGGVFVG